MAIKTKISILTFIMFLSLVGIGFASWTIATPDQNKTSENSPFVAEPSINSSEHVELVSSTSFTYFSNGFTTVDGKLTNSGTISITLNVKRATCAKFNFELKFASGIVAEMSIFDSISYSVSNSTIPSGNGTILEVDASQLTSDDIVISFVFTKNTNFKEDVYSVLNKYENEKIFAVSITVIEINQVE